MDYKMDYKDKIKKLLALAESPNENEAQAALLKARQLMAEHRLGNPHMEPGHGMLARLRILLRPTLHQQVCATRL